MEGVENEAENLHNRVCGGGGGGDNTGLEHEADSYIFSGKGRRSLNELIPRKDYRFLENPG